MFFTQQGKVPAYEFVPHSVKLPFVQVPRKCGERGGRAFFGKDVIAAWHDGFLKISKRSGWRSGFCGGDPFHGHGKTRYTRSYRASGDILAPPGYDCLFGGMAAAVTASEFCLADTAQMAREQNVHPCLRKGRRSFLKSRASFRESRGRVLKNACGG